MAIPVPLVLSGVRRQGLRSSAAVLVIAALLGGCSFNLGSLSSEPERETAPKAAPTGPSISEALAMTMHGEALARSGKTEEALAEFDNAITLDPHNAEALYNRGLLYQNDRKHQLAIEDFSSANGLTPLRSEPLLGRATSYLALDRTREAVADLDEAVGVDPQNARAWTARGLAYERLGDKAKAAESYGHAISLRPRDDAARIGFMRVGGKPG